MTRLSVSLVSPYNPTPTPGHEGDAIVGGVERAIDALAEALQEAGADVTVHCTSRVPGVDVRASGVRVHRVLRRAVLHRAPLSTLPIRALKDADVVHVPATYPTVSDLVPLFARLRRRPCVLDYHFDVHATSRGMHALARTYEATLGHAMGLADRIQIKTAEYAESSPVASRFPKEKLVVVPNGVHVERFRVDAPRSSSVLCVGRLVPYKGVDVLVRAMARVQQRIDAPLLVAGSGPERERLEALARELGVDAHFLGFVPDDELPELYASSRVTVLPSANGQEAFGITLLESMAAGTPVVASDLPGVRMVARLGGLTTPPKDVAALADAVTRVVSGEADVPHGSELSKRVEAEYSWRAIADRQLDVYEDVLAERRGFRLP